MANYADLAWQDAVAPPRWIVAVGGGGRAGLCREAAAATQARAQEEVPHLHFVSGDPDPLTAHPCALSLEVYVYLCILIR